MRPTEEFIKSIFDESDIIPLTDRGFTPTTRNIQMYCNELCSCNPNIDLDTIKQKMDKSDIKFRGLKKVRNIIESTLLPKVVKDVIIEDIVEDVEDIKEEVKETIDIKEEVKETIDIKEEVNDINKILQLYKDLDIRIKSLDSKLSDTTDIIFADMDKRIKKQEKIDIVKNAHKVEDAPNQTIAPAFGPVTSTADLYKKLLLGF